jgi:hypothetical protein
VIPIPGLQSLAEVDNAAKAVQERRALDARERAEMDHLNGQMMAQLPDHYQWLGCHPRDKIDASTHREFFAGTCGKSFCVDCHGKHRMATRKCKWK